MTSAHTRLSIALVGLTWLSPLPLFAQSLADQVAQVESLLAAGQDAEALAATRALHGTVWDTTVGLTIGEAVLTADPAPLWGIYNPRENDRFKAGEPILIYAEPMGFGYGSAGDGLYSIGFYVDLKVVRDTGELVGDLPGVTELNVTSRYMNREFPANLTYTLDGIAPGRYVLQTTLRDKNSAKIGSFDTSVEIVE